MTASAFPEGPIWLLGCGAMAGAMLRRWLDTGLDPARVTAITRSGRGVPAGVRSLSMPPPDEVPAVLILGVKPQQLGDVAPMLAAIRPALLLSILAGVEVATLAALAPGAPVVRAMPNLPVAIGRGVTGLFADGPDERLIDRVTGLMAPLGLVEWVDREDRLDVVAALSGSGPAFVYRFIEALARAGSALGLPEEQALRMALRTAEGAAVLAASAAESPGALAERVASVGGSTREGLNVLDADAGLGRLVEATLRAAVRRNRAMSEATRS